MAETGQRVVTWEDTRTNLYYSERWRWIYLDDGQGYYVGHEWKISELPWQPDDGFVATRLTLEEVKALVGILVNARLRLGFREVTDEDV